MMIDIFFNQRIFTGKKDFELAKKYLDSHPEAKFCLYIENETPNIIIDDSKGELPSLIKKYSKEERIWKPKRLKIKIIQEMFNGKCDDCGLYYDGTNGGSFEFHHLDPELKDENIGTLISKNKEDYLSQELIDELNKCVLLCANCHNVIHNGEY